MSHGMGGAQPSRVKTAAISARGGGVGTGGGGGQSVVGEGGELMSGRVDVVCIGVFRSVWVWVFE